MKPLIILEGADGAGKSTLGQWLASALGNSVNCECEYIYPKKPKSMKDAHNSIAHLRSLALNSSKMFLVDRAPWISDWVYHQALGRLPFVDPMYKQMGFGLPQMAIYCRPHEHKPVKGKEHKTDIEAKVIKKASVIKERYDFFFTNVYTSPFFVYNHQNTWEEKFDIPSWVQKLMKEYNT